MKRRARVGGLEWTAVLGDEPRRDGACRSGAIPTEALSGGCTPVRNSPNSPSLWSVTVAPPPPPFEQKRLAVGLLG